MDMATAIRRMVLCVCTGVVTYGQSLNNSGSDLVFSVQADQPVTAGQSFQIGVAPGLDRVPFEVSRIYVSGGKAPNFILVSPSSGFAPTTVTVSLNPNIVPYMIGGSYDMSLAFRSTDPAHPGGGGVLIDLLLHGPPPPSITSIINSASQQAVLSPGEIISIFGSNFGNLPLPANCRCATFPGQAASTTTVTIFGSPTPLLYVSPTQINAIVPYDIVLGEGLGGTYSGTYPVIVTHNFQSSPEFKPQVAETAPGIFTADASGRGQGAIENVDPQTGATSPNNVHNPASKGSTIVIFATGAGVWNQSPADGGIITDVLTPPYYVPQAAVSLTIGGQKATLLYAGAAPNQVSGVLQLNAVVPNGIGSGPQPVVLTIGNSDNSQQGATLAVQ